MHATTGHFIVVTESSSRYLIDFGRQILVRLPKVGDGLYETMRGDRHPVQLLHLMECVVVRSMWLRINLGVPGVLFTDRTTSTVVAIVEVPDDIGGQELNLLVCVLSQGAERVNGVPEALAGEAGPDGDC
ncbi:hypothetical protein QN350_13220 [Cryobacterium sp. 10I5]|nr:hypothetical protein [Cryobacterium sp. 10I5]